MLSATVQRVKNVEIECETGPITYYTVRVLGTGRYVETCLNHYDLLPLIEAFFPDTFIDLLLEGLEKCKKRHEELEAKKARLETQLQKEPREAHKEGISHELQSVEVEAKVLKEHTDKLLKLLKIRAILKGEEAGDIKL